jgi:membrane protein DedA with SNARE-associated domain
MPEQLADAPFIAIFVFFFTVVFVRTQATYWLTRLVATQALTRIQPRNRVMVRAKAWSTSESAERGIATLNRWGIIAVPLSFCAFGTKTVINGAAGLTRMPYGRYLPAMVVGCLIHATIYATIGWAAWSAALSAAAGSPWGVAALILVVIAAVLAVVAIRRRQSRATSVEPTTPE